MERGSDGRNKGIGKKWDLGSDDFTKREETGGLLMGIHCEI